MKEENNGTPKNKWSRIFRKKWFFPAVYIVVASLLLTAVVWFQNMDNQIPNAVDELEEANDFSPNPYGEDAQSVLDQQEVIKMPVADMDQAEIVTKFYDYNAEKEDQEHGLVLYNNRYYQSTGIDIAAAEGEEFEVLAALSGTVTEVKEDPLLGNVVILTHENDVMTYYASLGEVAVKAGSKVKQGDALGAAGKNIFGKDNGTHVHFQLRKDNMEVDPEVFFNQPVSKLDGVKQEENKDKEDMDESTKPVDDSDEDWNESWDDTDDLEDVDLDEELEDEEETDEE